MSEVSYGFEHALNVEVTQPHLFTAKRSGALLDGFIAMVKRAIESAGFGGLTRDEFLAIVSQAFDVFSKSMGLNPILAYALKIAALAIAGMIWDKRH